MSFKKPDLEIICNLKWKNGPSVNGGVKESMIGVYDIPATTLNWEVFKSYLLKNSGTTGSDVKISYLMESGKEYPIQSQTDFQVALYAFRRKARVGEIINLKLERISDQPNHKNLRHSNDAETQFDNNKHPSFISTTCCANNSMSDAAPEWFLTSIAQLKKEITEDVTATVSGIVSNALANVKPQIVPQPTSHHHSKKSKVEKRLKKISNAADGCGKVEAKELMKSFKLDYKLDKYERKANKIKEVRSMLSATARSSDSEAGHCSSRSRSHDKKDKEVKKMDAQPVKMQEFVPHMLGGEIYLHQWEVKNSGELPWTSNTYLQYTWGSKALEPLEKTISVPSLKPEETGIISAKLQVPSDPGRYECYWQFMHRGRRFGHWLGAQLIVDPFDLKGNRSVLETSTRNIELEADEGVSSAPEEIVRHYEKAMGPSKGIDRKAPEVQKEMYDLYKVYRKVAALNLKEQSQPLLSDSDTESNQDNQSVLSHDGSNDSAKSLKEEFVVVPSCFKIDNLELPIDHENILVNLDAPSTSGLQMKQQENTEDKQQNQVENVAKDPQDCDDNNNNSKDSLKTSIKSESSVSIFNGKTLEENMENGDSDYEVALVVEEDGKPVKDMVTKVKKGTKKDGFVFIKFNDSSKDQVLHLPKTILNSDLVQIIDGIEKTKTSEQIRPPTSLPTPSTTPEVGHGPIKQASVDPLIVERPEKSGQLLDLSTTGVDKGAVESGEAPKMEVKINQQPAAVEMGEISENVLQAAAVADEFMSHCSAAGSTFSEANQKNKRLFVFPTDCPGYEVVYPVLDHNESGEPMVYSQYYPAEDLPPTNMNSNPHYSYVPNYQQTPAHLRQSDPFYAASDIDPNNVTYNKPLPYNPAVYPANYPNCFDQAYSEYPMPTVTTSQNHYATATVSQNAANLGYLNMPPPSGNDLKWAYLDSSHAQQQSTGVPPNYVDYAVEVRDVQNAASRTQQQCREFVEYAENWAQRAPKWASERGDAVPEATRAQEVPIEATPNASQQESGGSGAVHILPEGIVNGAVNVASSAINTARNVMGMFKPTPGKWVNGHWVSANEQTPREANLQALHEMGFWNRDLNATLLARFNDDLNRVVTELIQ